jgi:beta-galactosidase
MSLKKNLSETVFKKIFYGADYNPEQWKLDPAILEEDFKLMKEARCTSMSLGIFSWTLYEPSEGKFEFEWMDRLMDQFADSGMKAFLATPSGSKPMWMSEKYPEIRKVDRSGNLEPSGRRHNHCLSSSVYKEKVRIINEKLAQRYAKHPALALWHLGNELQGECFCTGCLNRFHNWLEDKYKNLDALNEAWWARFWNHTITDWEQIDPRDETIDCLVMDWKRFTNDLHIEFIENERIPLDRHTPKIPCTTNYMGTHPQLNYGEWSKVLDVVSNDTYPEYDGSSKMWEHAAEVSMICDLMRGLNQGQPWMQMECSPSLVNWKRVNKLKRPGVHKMETTQYIAHGADTLHYFQFRKGRGGFEKFHGAIVDHDSRTDTRVFKEVQEVGERLEALEEVVGSKIVGNKTALIYDWESQWAINSSCGIKQPSLKKGVNIGTDAYNEIQYDHYRGAWSAGLGMDLLLALPEGLGELSNYNLILAPALYLLRDSVSEQLKEFVMNGGTLILSHRSGVVNEHNQVHLGGLPGLGLNEIAGVKVEEIDALFEHETVQVQGNSKTYSLRESLGRLYPMGAEVMFKYLDGPLKDQPAVTRNSLGQGEVWMLAANFDKEFYHDFYNSQVEAKRLSRSIDVKLPLGVASTKREKEEVAYHFLINYTDQVQTIELPKEDSFSNLETGEILQKVHLDAYGSIILKT